MQNRQNNEQALFSDTVSVVKGRKYITIEGRDVPITETWGKEGYKSYPKFRVGFAKKVASFNEKLLGISNPFNEAYFGTETLVVEKFKETYAKGIGNDAVDKLAQKGYNFKQISDKIGKPVLKGIEIAHMIKGIKQGKLNLMLIEGVDKIWDLVTEADAVNYYTNALARIGVGNSTTAAVNTQTGLIGGTTAFKAMSATFPLSTTSQRVDFKASFGSAEGNQAWEEFTVDNGSTPNHNLQRLVSSKGTKTSGETWTAEIRITGS